jgi:hypothetical protein
LAAICRREFESFKASGKRKLARNALAWEKHFLDEADRLAQRTTVIHWSQVPKGICPRKDSNIDEVSVSPTITKLASASHLENVDCLVCRRWARSRSGKAVAA